MFSNACKYGIKAVAYIATQSIENKRVKITDVAKKSGSPEAYTAKIMGQLTKGKIVISVKGPQGGFEMSREQMQQVTILQIVKIIDGDSLINDCVLGLSQCDSNQPCPMHNEFKLIKEQIKHLLETTTVNDLATKINSGDSTLIHKIIN